MFFWFAAAAVGVGYLAKHCQSIARDGDKDSLSLLQGNVAKDRIVSVETLSDISSSDDASGMEVVSLKMKEVLSISKLQSGFFRNENLEDQEVGNRLTGNVSHNCGDLSPKPSAEKMDSSNDSMRKRHTLRTKFCHARFIKPTSSVESCLMALLYKEHAKMEEYVLSSLPSPTTPTVRTLFVTNGSQVISSAYDNSFSARSGTDESKQSKEVCLENNENMHEVPPLLKIGNLDATKKMKTNTRKAQNGTSSNFNKMTNGKDFHFQGLQDRTVLFYVGISIGILCSFIKNRSEVDKLESLKQNEDLDQDLQEKLDDEALHFQKVEENSESISNIEAELEAELERLELNMKASTLERRLSDVVELDPDFVADFAQGELRVDKLGEVVATLQSNEDGASSSITHHSGNHAVSPRELSLRLHEVIQSRLEERVNELERALQNSQLIQSRLEECVNMLKTSLQNCERKIQIMASGHTYQGEFSNSQLRYSSIQESPVSGEDSNYMSHSPLVINLSGEALDAYNEAREELMKRSDLKKEDSPCRIHEDIQYCSHSFCQHSAIPEEKTLGELFPNSLRMQEEHSKEKTPGELFPNSLRMQEEHISLVPQSNDTSNSRGEISDCEDEMEKELIRQWKELGESLL